MFKAKITAVRKFDDGMAEAFDVDFTDGTNTISGTFEYAKYGFLTEDDIMNFLIGECDMLDAKYAGVEALEALVGVEDAVADIKADIAARPATVFSVKTPK